MNLRRVVNSIFVPKKDSGAIAKRVNQGLDNQATYILRKKTGTLREIGEKRTSTHFRRSATLALNKFQVKDNTKRKQIVDLIAQRMKRVQKLYESHGLSKINEQILRTDPELIEIHAKLENLLEGTEVTAARNKTRLDIFMQEFANSMHEISEHGA